jgi:hypothetical protein
MTENVTKHGKTALQEAEQFLTDRLVFTEGHYGLPLALFAALTHCWEECFETVPYLCITSATKGTGKTQAMELVSFLCLRPKMGTGITPPALFRTVHADHPTLCLDEVEKELSKPNSLFREILNNGYKSGIPVIRAAPGGGTVTYDVYCPKIYTMIGDPYETLRDRSIIVMMTRGVSINNEKRAVAQPVANEIGARLHALVWDRRVEIETTYLNYRDKLNFLINLRDRELWEPLFAICEVLAPGRIKELKETAVTVSTLKTREARKFTQLRDEEVRAMETQYAERLLDDMAFVMSNTKHVATSVLIQRLRGLTQSPWRSYRGTGITEDRRGHNLLATMVAPFGVFPKTIRVKPKGEVSSTAKGYVAADVVRAFKELNPKKPYRRNGKPTKCATKQNGNGFKLTTLC